MMGKQVATGRLPRKMVTNGFCPAPAPPAAPLPPEKVSHQIKGAKEKLLGQMRSNEIQSCDVIQRPKPKVNPTQEENSKEFVYTQLSNCLLRLDSNQ